MERNFDMIKLKAITNMSWLVMDDASDNPVGILSEKPNGSFFMVLGDSKFDFDSKADLQSSLNMDLFGTVIKNETITKEEQTYINGIPISFPNVIPVQDHPSGLPTFAKNVNSDVLYCAGHYCLKRKSGWTHSYCAKLDTLERYDYEGPFATEEECGAKLLDLKNNDKRQKRKKKSGFK
jgi:hypothetical protein